MTKLEEWIEKYKPPYIKPAQKGKPCDGIKYSTVALRDLYDMYGKTARGIQPRSRCKNKAKWHFVATKVLRKWDVPATSGNYCHIHLIMQLERDAEVRRAQRLEIRRGME